MIIVAKRLCGLVQIGPTIEKLANRIADPERTVREALKTLFHETLLSDFGSKLLAPFISLLMAHVCSAMTHLQANIRYLLPELNPQGVDDA